MKNTELCKTAIDAGLSRFGNIKYRTGGDWRYNVGLWTGQHWSFDCLGFVHCLVNGFVGDKNKLGGGAVMDDFVLNAPEIKTLYDYCYDQSSDFLHIDKGELLYMDGHVGLYVGDCEPFNDGRIFNVAECCYSSFGGGGMLTYVSQFGIRSNWKGGTSVGNWTHHGKFYRVDYIDDGEDSKPAQDTMTPSEILNVANDTFIGKYGVDPERKAELVHQFGEKVHRQVQDILNILYR